MIPEYKFYHGAVLAEIVDGYVPGVSITAIRDSDRLLNYVLNEHIGLQIKYATQRLRPWPFTFPTSHIDALKELDANFQFSFLVLVCRDDGIIAVHAADILPTLVAADGEQSWLRADRKKHEMYRLHGPTGEFSLKLKTSVEPILSALHQIKRSKT